MQPSQEQSISKSKQMVGSKLLLSNRTTTQTPQRKVTMELSSKMCILNRSNLVRHAKQGDTNKKRSTTSKQWQHCTCGQLHCGSQPTKCMCIAIDLTTKTTKKQTSEQQDKTAEVLTPSLTTSRETATMAKLRLES